MTTPTRAVQQHGQSIWLDFISRDLLLSGELAPAGRRRRRPRRHLEPGDLREGHRRQRRLRPADPSPSPPRARATPTAIFERLAIADIQLGCDVLRPVYDATRAAPTASSASRSRPTSPTTRRRTIAEARRLWAAVDRPNLMIKVPAHAPRACRRSRQLIGEGINVNVTLLFAVDAYEAVHRGLSRGARGACVANGGPVGPRGQRRELLRQPDRRDGREARREASWPSASDPTARRASRRCVAKVAIANAKLAYASFRRELASDALAGARRGAHGPSACSGPAPAPRTPTYRRRSTSTS